MLQRPELFGAVVSGVKSIEYQADIVSFLAKLGGPILELPKIAT
jgi:hypothetical protein